MDSVGEGEGGKIWENGIETCVISCMKRVASPGSMHDTGCLGLVHWDDPEGWCGGGRKEEGSGWGAYVYLWRIHFDVWQNEYSVSGLKKKWYLKIYFNIFWMLFVQWVQISYYVTVLAIDAKTI